MERAELGVDGNCGFALLGKNIQEGEAEFVVIDSTSEVGSFEWCRMASLAATKAYRNLKARLPNRNFSYFIGESHPYYY